MQKNRFGIWPSKTHMVVDLVVTTGIAIWLIKSIRDNDKEMKQWDEAAEYMKSDAARMTIVR